MSKEKFVKIFATVAMLSWPIGILLGMYTNRIEFLLLPLSLFFAFLASLIWID